MVIYYDRRLAFDIDRVFYEICIKPAIVDAVYEAIIKKPQTKAEKNQARLKQLRGRAGRWA
mgnify:CR=1 FL=1